MTKLTTQIQNYLIEIEEDGASHFLSDSIIQEFYVDTLFNDMDEYSTDLFDVIIYVPAKKFKNLNEYTKITKAIERAINENADGDGVQISTISWKLLTKSTEQINEIQKGDAIINLFDNDNYVRAKIQLMDSNIVNAPHLAIGTAKELIETCCKSILINHSVTIDNNWDILKLVKETNKVMTFESEAGDELDLKQSINLILGGLSNVVHGITELRNKFGSGHGHEPNFRELDEVYTRLAVSVSKEFVSFYLKIFKKRKDIK